MTTADFDTLTHIAQLPILLELAEAATHHYDLPSSLNVKLINLSENTTYKVEAPDGRRWALRIHRDGYHSKIAIASELAWLMDLRQSGVVVTPKPVQGRDGEIIQVIGHPRLKAPRHIVLSEWETGAEPGIGENLEAPFEVLGEVTARMHKHTQGWKRPSWKKNSDSTTTAAPRKGAWPRRC